MGSLSLIGLGLYDEKDLTLRGIEEAKNSDEVFIYTYTGIWFGNLKKIEKLWRALGARVILLSTDKHDKALAFVSHLPHIVAFSLINVIPADFLKFSSSGLKDTTRIAASSSNLWEDIFFSNKKAALPWPPVVKHYLIDISPCRDNVQIAFPWRLG
jgi:hypothetical protein